MDKFQSKKATQVKSTQALRQCHTDLHGLISEFDHEYPTVNSKRKLAIIIAKLSTILAES